MAIDKKLIGKKYPSVEYVVGKEKIKEYAIAITDTNVLYIDEEKARKDKFGDIIAPPSFAVVYVKDLLNLVLQDEELSLNLETLLHSEQEFEFFEIVKPKDIITTTAEIIDIRSKANLDFITILSTSKNQYNKLVSKGKWTFIVRET